MSIRNVLIWNLAMLRMLEGNVYIITLVMMSLAIAIYRCSYVLR